MAIKKEETRGRATFNLSFKITDKLETKWMKLRTMLRKHNVSKSGIVEEAVQIILDDFDKNQENSKIYKALSKKQND